MRKYILAAIITRQYLITHQPRIGNAVINKCIHESNHETQRTINVVASP